MNKNKKTMHSRKEEEQGKRVMITIGIIAVVLVIAMLVGYSVLGK
ncbi:hypothetical protein Bache_0417 [Bacteroides helcogenes P 36-108]|uniref:Uncharacterized protein n=1 Tax=Bacteroides helcogenes (strain ATCC 35417 / DSM 20613 / JCM 6297 / CCUG 15421 / P 36-108) TaxID=693979 RepID=E6SV08_BACT6|nr:hypothetical protein Bache_0417 [Bacteroides helcogenes P 36-108]